MRKTKSKAGKRKGLGTVTKSKASSKNNGMVLALGAAVAGAAFFMIKGKNKDSDYSVPNSAVSPTTSTVVKPKTSTTSPIKPIPALTDSTSFDNTVKSHVFVNSWPEGESIFGKAENKIFGSAASDRIVIILHNSYLGKLTGREAKDPLYSYVEVGSFIDGKFRTYWVDKKQVKFVTDAEREKLLKGGGSSVIRDWQLNAIRNYYKGR